MWKKLKKIMKQEKDNEVIEEQEIPVDQEVPQEEAAQESEVDTLKKELEATKKELQKAKEDYLYLMSDFQNFRRGAAKEKLDLLNTAAENTIKGMLPVLDDIEIALAAVKDEASLEGLNLIYTKLTNYLKSKGLEKIEAKDEPFDTELHEAVAQFPVAEEDRKGLVFDVTQNGYKLNGKVIRFAKVVVAI